jgi:hypothetical protein
VGFADMQGFKTGFSAPSEVIAWISISRDPQDLTNDFAQFLN